MKTGRRNSWLSRDTEDQFARKIENLAELRPEHRAILLETLSPGEHIRWLIYVPYQAVLKSRDPKRRAFRFFLPWQFTPDWLLALTPTRLLLVSLPPHGDPPQVSSIPLENLLYLQSGVILLFSWFKLAWVEQGAVRQETVYYNAVCERIFDVLSEMVRAGLPAGADGPPAHPLDNHEALAPLPYKFKNLIPLRLLLPGEQIALVVFRAATFKRSLGLFRQMLSPRMALVLTDRHLLLAEEDLSVSEGSYGLISTFLPLQRLCAVPLTRTGQRIELTLQLELHNARKDLVVSFPLALESELQELQRLLRLPG